ncbi:MAG: hypothetical protein HRU25_14825 [Psychrobium sp.]|nr:hypothetical protein [Psychrobium sp.]
MSDHNVDDVLDSGDEADFEKLLAEIEGDGDQTVEEPKQEIATNDSETDVITDSSTAQESTDAEDQAVTQDKVTEQPADKTLEASKIISKNGEHFLPYSELSTSREATASAKKALETANAENVTLKQQIADSSKMAKLYSKQLADAGIDLQLTPEQILNDPEKLQTLEEDHPEIGGVVAALAAQIQSLQPTKQQELTQEVELPPDEFTKAFNDTSLLKGWFENDPKRWKIAQQIDDLLIDDPSFLTHSERLAEVEKRVGQAFGDTVTTALTKDVVDTPAAKEIVKPTAPIPNTPTDIGHQDSGLDQNANLADQDVSTIAERMSNMSEAEIDDLLSGV